MSAPTRVLAIVWLTVVWSAVMESISIGTVVAGAVVASVLTLLFPSPAGTLTGTRFRPWPFVVMNVTLFTALVRANLQVAWAVITPERAGLRRGIVAVPLVPSTEVVLNLVLNAVSLTPGTLILEVRRDPLVLYVHVLQLRTEADVHLEVLAMERTIVRALGPADALAPIDDRIATITAAAHSGGALPPLTRASDPTGPAPEEDGR